MNLGDDAPKPVGTLVWAGWHEVPMPHCVHEYTPPVVNPSDPLAQRGKCGKCGVAMNEPAGFVPFSWLIPPHIEPGVTDEVSQ